MKRLILVTLWLAAFLSSSVIAYGQRSVSGTVVSGAEPVAGAIVYVQGTQNGTITDADGKFAVTAKDGAVLCVECLGFKDGKITVERGVASYRIELEVDSQVLEDVVVVGYGSMKKSDLTVSSDSDNRTCARILRSIHYLKSCCTTLQKALNRIARPIL